MWYDLKQSEVTAQLEKGKSMDTLKQHLASTNRGLISLDLQLADLVKQELKK